MQFALSRLQTWAGTVSADARLNPGATEMDFRAFEKRTGVRVPPELRELYRWHNGQSEDCDYGFFYGLEFLSLDRVASHWESWDTVLNGFSPEALDDLSLSLLSTPPGFVNRTYHDRDWICFAFDYGGNYLAVDTAPGVKGTVGQVITCGRDEDRRIVLAPSLSHFMTWFTNELCAKNFVFEEVAPSKVTLNMATPESSHFLDAAAQLHPRTL